MIMRVRPKISIVMPVYNGGFYFEMALQSALAQTYPNIEIVIVNDGSTDNGETDAICRRYAEKHPDIINYILQKNTGAGGALNHGVRAMTGDIFCWLSHDDLYEPHKLASQIAFFERLGKDDAILISDYRLIDPQGEVLHEVRFNHQMAVDSPRLPLFRGWINGCTVFIPAHLLEKSGPFEAQYFHVQDYRLWHKLLEKHEFFHQPELLVRYRLHPGQDSQKPEAVTEGDALWTDMIDACTLVERSQLSRSSWRFFDQCHTHLKSSIYKTTAAYALARRDSCIGETLVSVVIPAFNEPEVALRALASVQAQTHRNLDIVVVDDGSTDSLQALYDLAAGDGRIRIVRQENAGPGAARNRGLTESRGEYVAFLDADDAFLPQKIERQLDAMQRAGAMISHTSYYVTYPSRRPGYGVLRSGRFSGKVYPAILRGCAMATPTVMIHRALVASGFRFPVESHLGEDVVTWIEACQRHPLLGLDDPLSVVEWADSSAAIDMRKGLAGVGFQLRTLQANFTHGRRPELKNLAGVATYLRRRLEGHTEDRVIDEVLIEEAFGPPGRELKSAKAEPRRPIDFDPFFAAYEHRQVNLGAELQRIADMEIELREIGHRTFDIDLTAPFQHYKNPVEGNPPDEGVIFSSGVTDWDYVAGIGLDPQIAPRSTYLRATVHSSADRLYLMLVDEAYNPIGERQLIEPSPVASTRWFNLKGLPAPAALVVQAGESPKASSVRLSRVALLTAEGVR